MILLVLRDCFYDIAFHSAQNVITVSFIKSLTFNVPCISKSGIKIKRNYFLFTTQFFSLRSGFGREGLIVFSKFPEAAVRRCSSQYTFLMSN